MVVTSVHKRSEGLDRFDFLGKQVLDVVRACTVWPVAIGIIHEANVLALLFSVV